MYAFYLHGENQALKEQNVELQSSPYYQAQKIGEDRAVKKDALDKAKVARDDIYARTDKERA